jgi:hypothetical protein
MGLPRGVHVQAHLWDDIGDVELGESQVLEGAGQAPVGRRVGDRGPIILRELRLSVDMWSRACSRTCQPAPGCRWRTDGGGGRDHEAGARR